MPIPKRIAHFNKHVTNRLTRPAASRLPGFAVVTHVGRRSGRTYRTPVNVFREGDRYVVALTYGADSDWVRNVLAAGGCELAIRGRTIAVGSPEVISDPSGRLVPRPPRWILAALHVTEFLALRPTR